MLPYFKGAPHVELFLTQISGNLRNSDWGETETSNRPREKKEGGKGDEHREKRAKKNKRRQVETVKIRPFESDELTESYFFECLTSKSLLSEAEIRGPSHFETTGLRVVYFQVKTTKDQ